MSDEQEKPQGTPGEPEHAPGYSKEERTAWVCGLKSGQKLRTDAAIGDIAQSIEEIRAAIKSGDFGPVDAKKIIDHLAALALVPWSRSMRARFILQAQVKVLDMLCRCMGMFVDRLEVEEKTDLAQQLKDALTRVSRICQPPREKATRN